MLSHRNDYFYFSETLSNSLGSISGHLLFFLALCSPSENLQPFFPASLPLS